jgi:hypothetical protein
MALSIYTSNDDAHTVISSIKLRGLIAREWLRVRHRCQGDPLALALLKAAVSESLTLEKARRTRTGRRAVYRISAQAASRLVVLQQITNAPQETSTTWLEAAKTAPITVLARGLCQRLSEIGIARPYCADLTEFVWQWDVRADTGAP